MEIFCACGCGQKIKDKDSRGRSRVFIRGHNGRNPSKETIEKLKAATIGVNNPFYGKSHSPETKSLMKKNHKGMKGKKHKKTTKQKQRNSNPKIWLGKRGQETPNWRGGATSLYFIIRNCEKMKEWRLAVFKRDNFICKKCGFSKGVSLNAHHVEPFNTILQKNNIQTLSEAEKCFELWDIDNGITFCKLCHIDEHRI